MTVRRWLTVSLLLAVAAIVAGCGDDNGGGAGDGGKNGGSASKKSDCGFKATTTCTPHAGPGGKVRVDALVWRVLGAETAKTIGEQQYGLGAKADGVYVVLDLKVTSKKDESTTLTDNVIQLEGGNDKFDPDNEGTVAAIGSGQDPLFLKDLGPESTTRTKVVFDVPKRFLRKKVEVRFNELGFGSTHGYIKLPSNVSGV